MSSKCAKCRTAERVAGDTWCIGCGAWEILGSELTGRWPGPAGLRTVAENLVLGAAREVRALRSISAGLGRASGGAGTVPPAVPEPEQAAGSSRAACLAGLAAKSAAKPKQGSEEYSYTYESYSEEEEEEEPGEVARRKAAPVSPEKPLQRREEAPGAADVRDRRAAGSDKPKGRREEEEAPHERRVKEEEKAEELAREEKKKEKKRADKEAKRRKEEEEERKEGKRPREEAEEREEPPEGGEKPKKKKKKKRGGRKHKRVHRLAERPYLEIHRGLPERILRERPALPVGREKKRRE